MGKAEEKVNKFMGYFVIGCIGFLLGMLFFLSVLSGSDVIIPEEVADDLCAEI